MGMNVTEATVDLSTLAPAQKRALLEELFLWQAREMGADRLCIDLYYVVLRYGGGGIPRWNVQVERGTTPFETEVTAETLDKAILLCAPEPGDERD